MPVHKARGGYRWGQHGKVYRSKEAAERQGRAAYANGYRGDGRRIRPVDLRPSPRAEGRYVRDLKSIIGEVHKGYMRTVGPKERKDAAHLQDALIRYVRAETGRAFDKMASDVDKKSSKAARKLFGIDPRGMSTHVEIQKFRDQNIALMEKAGQEYASQVRGVIDDPNNFGLRVEDLAKKLQERAGVAQSHAELIARDQTLKLSSQLNVTRAQNAGAKEFDWSTSGDERVRPDHADLDGQRFSYLQPPVTDKRTGARNLPGMDFQCRCVPLPVIEGLEGI